VRPEKVDAKNRPATVKVLRGCDLALGALPHGLSLGLVEAAVEAGTSLVDLVGEGAAARAALDARAKEAGCLVIPGCGVAPGISNFCIGQGVKLVDQAESGSIYVGGIPREKRPPLYYETVYLLESVFNAYTREAVLIRNGEEVKVKPLAGLESVRFPEPIGTLEAFYTDGLASLSVTMRDTFKKELFEKTLRYPGHVERVELLKQCGLLGDDPVQVGDAEVVPRRVLLRLLEEPLRLGPEGDILAMRVVVEGVKGGRPKKHTFELIDFYDAEKKHTAMARTTGFTAACAARLITSGDIPDKGVLFPEQIFIGPRYDRITGALAERGVEVKHTES
jgi:lysine 6-dehydrogenase